MEGVSAAVTFARAGYREADAVRSVHEPPSQYQVSSKYFVRPWLVPA